MATSQSHSRIQPHSTGARIVLLWLCLSSLGCPPSDQTSPSHVTISEVNLQLPIPEDWIVTTSVHMEDPAKGGDVLQLTPASTVPGSPRVVVTLSPLSTQPPSLRELSRQTKREMDSMKKSNKVTFTNQSQTSRQFAGQDAMEFNQSYTLGVGASTIAVNQFQLVTVLNGRGVSVTAGGRSELYTPFEKSITQMLQNAQFLQPLKTAP